MMSSLLNFASPGGKHGRLSVLVLHRVLPEHDPLFPEAIDAQRFDQMCGWLRSMFNTLALDQAVRLIAAGRLPRRALCITFDDGYADNLQVAMPILKRHGLSATFFIATGFLDGGCMWNDRVTEAFRLTTEPSLDLHSLLGDPQAVYATNRPAQRRAALEATIDKIKYLPPPERLAMADAIAGLARVKLPTNLMMTSAQLLALHRSGMQVGAHTVSHPILTTLSATQMRQEMADSKVFLEQLLGEPVPLFAYPNGKPGTDFNATSVSMAREVGFEAAVTTAKGAATHHTDLLQLPRFTPWDRSRWRFGLRMTTTLLGSRNGSEIVA